MHFLGWVTAVCEAGDELVVIGEGKMGRIREHKGENYTVNWVDLAGGLEPGGERGTVQFNRNALRVGRKR